MSQAELARIFNLDRLLAAACERAGLTPSDDSELIEPLGYILADIVSGATGIAGHGVQAMEAYLIESLATRLRLRAQIAAEPSIAREEIIAPIIIAGLPRTGSTKLQRVLAATGHFQSLPLWKIMSPLRGPGDRNEDEARRLAIAEGVVTQIRQAFPRFYAGHPMVASEPDEESLLIETVFRSDPPCWRAELPGFMQWLLQQNIESSYRWFKSVLQILQWQDEPAGRKRRWVLKAPIHLGHIEEMFAVFPDAVMIQCHRDPAISLPSGAALAEEMRGFCAPRDAHKAGRFVMELLSHDMAKCLRARDRLEPLGKTIIDLQFADITQRADTSCEQLFRRIGMDYDAQARSGIARWEEDNPMNKHGKFDYDLERYGMTRAEVERNFGEYAARYVR